MLELIQVLAIVKVLVEVLPNETFLEVLRATIMAFPRVQPPIPGERTSGVSP